MAPGPSASDGNAGFSVRPDHQWNGAYPAWPADSTRAAIQFGGAGTVAEWLPGLARTTRQGPPGQAHVVEEAVDAVEGGARKAPPQFPYLIDWSCSSAGEWCELVIESIFGVKLHPDGSVTANPVLDQFDPDARLVGLTVAGVTYDADGSGVRARTQGDLHDVADGQPPNGLLMGLDDVDPGFSGGGADGGAGR